MNQKFGRRKNVMGFRSWSRGYCVSTVGLEEQVIRRYIRSQEEREIQEEQLSLNY
jgi:putative transposase